MNLQTLQLRPYQSQLISNIYTQWQQHRRVLAQLPTGGGKTIVFSQIAQDAIQRGDRVLVLAHREELILQARDKLQNITGASAGIIKSGYPMDPDAPIQVASVQSLVNRLSQCPAPSLIVVDECHHSIAASWRRCIEAFPQAKILGVTATPCRLDGSGFDDLFDALVCGPSTKQLIEDGYLSPFKLYAARSPMITRGVRRQCGDFSASQIAQQNDIVELSGNLVQSYLQYCPGKRAIAFAVNVEHSKAIAARYNAAGIPAAHLDGNTPSEVRRATQGQFARGELLVLSNVGLFTEGFDLPALDAVQVARPTASLALHLQMLGRSLRTSLGKENAIIIDHSKNWAIHGLPSAEHQWSLAGVEKPQAKTKPVREPSGEVVERVIVEQSHEVLQEISEEQIWLGKYQKLIDKQQGKQYKKYWIFHQLVKLRAPLFIWQAYAEYMGYKPGWAWHQHRQMQAG